MSEAHKAADETIDRIDVTRTIHARAARIFAEVSDPAGHVRIDGSGMLLVAPDAVAVHAVGDTFVMNMDREPLGDIPMGRYSVLNTVTKFVPDQLIEWSVAAHGRSIGHVYGYELEPLDEHTTQVTNYCDWTNLDPAIRPLVTFPIVPASMLEQTLARLQVLVEAD